MLSKSIEVGMMLVSPTNWSGAPISMMVTTCSEMILKGQSGTMSDRFVFKGNFVGLITIKFFENILFAVIFWKPIHSCE